MDLTWFNYADSALKKYKVGTEYVVFGRPQVFNGRIQLVHPDMEEADKLELSAMGMQPYYNTSEKMKKSSLNSRAIEKLTKTLIDTLKEPIPETIVATKLCATSTIRRMPNNWSRPAYA